MAKKNVLICGATGFIGRNLCEHFAALDRYEVTGIYHSSEPYSHPGVKLIQADLLDPGEVRRVMQGVDILIQAAATTSGSKDIVNSPYLHVTDNAIMNSLLFREAFEQFVSQVVFFSCSVMYPFSEKPLKESDFDANAALFPNYFGVGWTKVYLEKMCKFYSRLTRNKFTVIRHSNIYGPYDKFDLEKSHVFGATLTKVMKADDKIIVWGTGEESRDLLYVSDLVEFVQRAIEGPSKSFSLYNVGCGRGIQISDLVKKIISHSGKEIAIDYDTTKPTIKTSVVLDCFKAKSELSWEPKMSLDESIWKTMDWYRHNVLT